MGTNAEEDIFFAYWQSQQSQKKKPAVDMRTAQRGYEYMREFLDPALQAIPLLVRVPPGARATRAPLRARARGQQ